MSENKEGCTYYLDPELPFEKGICQKEGEHEEHEFEIDVTDDKYNYHAKVKFTLERYDK